MREIVSSGKPGQHTVPFPSPRNDFLVDDAVRSEMPAVLRRIGGDTSKEAVIVPAKRYENVLLLRLHASRTTQTFAGASRGTSACIAASASR